MSDSDTAAVVGNTEGEPSARAKAGTFCVRLWQHMRLIAGGEARVCCAYQGKSVAQDGVPVSTDRQSLMEIWNADTMRDLRRDMVAGLRVAGCVECYTVEDRGGISVRLKDNMSWEQGALSEPRATFDEMMTLAVENDFHLPKLPAMIEVETGNLCNLKCRTCNSFSSSRIAKDPVQRKWDGFQLAHYDDPEAEIVPGKIRRAGPIESLLDELAQDTGSQVKTLYFLGGEPFLVREIPGLLERLVAVDRASQLSLLFISNGTVVPEWLALAPQFYRVYLAVSVDGYADHFDYIRYPGRWSKLAQHLQQFKHIPNLYLRVTTTVQVYNALSITNLFRYLDSVEIDYTGYLLHNPHHHAVGALPSSIRRLGAARLRDYAEDDCRPEHRTLVRSLAAEFEAGDDQVDPAVLRDFMLFTNDMDTSHKQSIHGIDPELVALLEQAGFPWLNETLHAPAVQKMPYRPHSPVPAQTEAFRLHRDLSMAIAALREELVQSRHETGRARAEIERADDEINKARAETKHIRDSLRQTFDELQHARDELQQTRDELTTNEERGAHLEQQLAQVYASRSWRATRPLRAGGRTLHRWLRAEDVPGTSSAR
jgi:MoaA/NifB/PqqE/SkfB family radical SAM enzyme